MEAHSNVVGTPYRCRAGWWPWLLVTPAPTGLRLSWEAVRLSLYLIWAGEPSDQRLLKSSLMLSDSPVMSNRTKYMNLSHPIRLLKHILAQTTSQFTLKITISSKGARGHWGGASAVSLHEQPPPHKWVFFTSESNWLISYIFHTSSRTRLAILMPRVIWPTTHNIEILSCMLNRLQ